MTKQEFLSACLPYRLWCETLDYQNDYVGKRFDLVVGYNQWSSDGKLWSLALEGGSKPSIERVRPIIRPISDLTKECVQADYNNGKPFVPIVELAKLMYPRHEWSLSKNKTFAISLQYKMIFEYDDGYNCFLCDNSAQMNQIQLFQQLLKWHFDLITEDCEKVYVTEEFNPYK